MTHEPDKERPTIVQLLALKRWENPPPGYFDRFPAQVVARIQAQLDCGNQPGESLWARWLAWQRGLVGFEALTVAGVAVLAACAVRIAISGGGNEGQAAFSVQPKPEAVAAGFPGDAARWGRWSDAAQPAAPLALGAPREAGAGTNGDAPALLFSIPRSRTAEVRFESPDGH